MKRVNVLFTCCLGDYVKGTIDCLKKDKKLKVRIIGTDIEPMIYNFNDIDSFYCVSRCSNSNYLQEIKNICLLEKVDVIIPTHTTEQSLFCENIQWFEEKNIKVIVCKNKDVLETLTDKYKASLSYESVITSNEVQTLEDVLKYEKEEGQWCIKQKNNCGARGFYKIDFSKKQEIESVLNSNETNIIQKYLSGDEYTVDCFCKNGIVESCVVKYNPRMENGVALESIVVNNTKVANVCKQICDKSCYSGPIGFDVKLDEFGKPFVIDINPRFTATVSLCEKAGANIPLFALKDVLGMKVCFPKALNVGVMVVRKKRDIFITKGV